MQLHSITRLHTFSFWFDLFVWRFSLILFEIDGLSPCRSELFLQICRNMAALQVKMTILSDTRTSISKKGNCGLLPRSIFCRLKWMHEKMEQTYKKNRIITTSWLHVTVYMMSDHFTVILNMIITIRNLNHSWWLIHPIDLCCPIGDDSFCLLKPC